MPAAVLPVRPAQVEECALDGLALRLVDGDRPCELRRHLGAMDLDAVEVAHEAEDEVLAAEHVRAAALLVDGVHAAPLERGDAEQLMFFTRPASLSTVLGSMTRSPRLSLVVESGTEWSAWSNMSASSRSASIASSVLSSSANNGVGCCDDKSYYYCPKAVRHNSL